MTIQCRDTAGALAAAVLVLAGCGTSPAEENSDSGSGCYGPWLDNDPSGEPPDSVPPSPSVTVSPGATIKIYGHGYTFTCNDTGEDGALKPVGAVELTLTSPDGTQEQLGRFAPMVANGDAGFVADVTVPAGMQAGAVVVSDDRSPAASYRIAVQP